MTGLPLDTLRAWERRYSAVTPHQDARGRMYTEQQVQRLILLRTIVELGYAIGQVAGESDARLRAILKSAEKPGSSPEISDSSELIEPVLAAIDKYDLAGADRELNRLAASIADPRMLVHRIALPLIRQAGERWHQGKFRIAQEHMTTSLLSNLLASLMRMYTPGRTPARVLLATPAGEQHAVALLAAAMLTAAGGLGAVYLGSDLPVDEIVFAAKKTECDAILLGLTVVREKDIEADLEAIARKAPSATRLWLAGPGVKEKHRPQERWAVLTDFHALEAKLISLGAKF